MRGVSESAVTSLFSDQKPSCFLNSTWNLTNSGNGSYTLQGGNNCNATTQNIYWSAALADDTFQFKRLNAGEKAQNVSDGYRMVLYTATGDNLVLKLPVEVSSGSANVVLSFSRMAK